MVNPVTKVISANDVKNGQLVSYVTKNGTIQSYALGDANSVTGMDLDTRFDNPRFYRGDSNGLQSTTTYTIAAGADDGIALKSLTAATSNTTYDSTFRHTSSKEYIGSQYDDEEIEYDYRAGFFRFNNVVAAQGATVQSAYLKLNKRGYAGGSSNHDFYVAALDADNQAAPTTAGGLNHSNYTTAEVTWGNNTDTGNGTLRSAANGTVLSSPDIKTVIQEILDRSGWSSGNSIVITFYTKTAYTDGSAMPYIEMYDDSGDVPPQLEITI